MSYRAICNHFG